MHMRSRGFTIIEVLVVIGVIAVLAGIVTSTFIVYQDRSYDAQAKSLAASIRSAAERYFTRNNEYPSAAQLFGGTPTGSVPSNLGTASQLLDVPLSTLNGNYVKLLPCAGASATCTPSTGLDETKVYYLTKADTDGTTARAYSILTAPGSGTCTYTHPATETIRESYIIAYWSNDANIWKISRSNNGNVATSDGFWCPFTEL